jgi:hypothetical protein
MDPRRALILASGITVLVACKQRPADDVKTPALAQNVASACKDVDSGRMGDASAPRPASGYTPLPVRDSLLRRIQAGEQKWRGARPELYTLTVVASCFCRDRGNPIVLRVRGDAVVDSRDTTGQQSWPDDWRTSLHVAGLFKEARQAACDSTLTTRVTLDPRFGYPRLLSAQSRLEVSDAEREYRVLSFAPEPAP